MTIAATTHDRSRLYLDRTLRLLRDDLRPNVDESRLLDALVGTTVVIVADRANLRFPSAQVAITTAALLCARSGAQIWIAAPNVALSGVRAPLTKPFLLDGLHDIGEDLIPGCVITPEQPDEKVDLAIVMGDSPCSGRARDVVHLAATEWSGHLRRGGAPRWGETSGPFGALAAAGLAAGEAFKVSARRLADSAVDPNWFADLYAPAQQANVALAPEGTPGPGQNVGPVDIVSGGAITHAALFALSRIPDVIGQVRVIEPETSDESNLNRYAFLRNSSCGQSKADALAAEALAGLTVTGVRKKYVEGDAPLLDGFAPCVLVGVDDIPTRWAVQADRPLWLGVGATSHYSAMASWHERNMPCARCLHPRDEVTRGPLPTAAFVTHWAGVFLASLLARRTSRFLLGAAEQQVFATLLRPDAPMAVWRSPVAADPLCRLCGAPGTTGR